MAHAFDWGVVKEITDKNIDIATSKIVDLLTQTQQETLGWIEKEIETNHYITIDEFRKHIKKKMEDK